VAVRSDSTLHTWGSNCNGQLGLNGAGCATFQNSPQQVGTSSNWIDAAAGFSHTVGIRNDGTVWAWGEDSNDQLGFGSNSGTNFTTPTQVVGMIGAVRVTCGGESGNTRTAVIGPFGTVWTWGTGYLGFPYPTTSSVPVQVPGLAGIVSIACGRHHTMVLLEGGSVWSWGTNSSGQLGDGTTTTRYAPGPVIGLPMPIVGIAATAFTSYALAADGSIWAWGANNLGALGVGAYLPVQSLYPTMVAALTAITAIEGSSHPLAIRNDGTAWTWGTDLVGSTIAVPSSTEWSPHIVAGLIGPPFGAYINAAASFTAGSTFDLTVFSSAPVAPLFVFADTATASIPIDIGGQILGTFHLAFSPSFIAITDPIGTFGGGFTYPYTNLFGTWNLQATVPAPAAGLTFYCESFVLSPAAANGLFYQSNLISITIQ
jgi:hypothetical protein